MAPTPGRTVGQRTYTADLTVPPGTTAAAPATIGQEVGDVILQDVRVVIPYGHSFLTGLYIAYSGIPVVPFNDPPTFLVGDGSDRTYPVNIQVTQDVELVAYNTDLYPHAFHVELHVSDWEPAPVRSTGQLSAAAIEAAR